MRGSGSFTDPRVGEGRPESGYVLGPESPVRRSGKVLPPHRGLSRDALKTSAQDVR